MSARPQVRRTATMSPERTARAQALAAQHLTWQQLSEEEVAEKLRAADERRRQLALKMPRAQFEKEQK